ncbi:MAG: NfeD family protein [Planctomycetota bacterium]|nr:NfeD family protein [Planctomycetota bacterium]
MFQTILTIALLAISQTAPVPSYRQATDVVVITIDGVVDSVTAQSFSRRLEEARDADAIVVDLNTPGGDLMATLEICYELKNNAPNNTVAWIHPHAFSAGTIIALACREIIAAPGSTFGDAAPINSTGLPIPATERAKIESPVLTEVIDSARRNHYDERLVEAFVSVGIELWLIEHQETGETICLNAREFEELFNKPPPQNFTPIGTSKASKSTLSPFFETLAEFANEVQAESQTLDPLFVQQLPPSRKRIQKEDANSWVLVRQIVPNDRLLTLKPAEAKMYGLIVDTITNDIELQQWLGATSLTRVNQNWSEGLVRILVSWPIRLVLIAIFIVCMLVEMGTGTTGLFSIGGVISMTMLIGAPWLAGLSTWWDILLVITGLLLISVEVLVIPGTGFTGIAGIGCLFAGMIGSFVSGDLGSAEGQAQLLTGLGTMLGGCILAGVAAWLIIKYLGGATTVQRLVLEGELSGRSQRRKNPPKIHSTAIAATDLRPSGRIRINDQIFDATTTGGWISKGATVRIMRIGLTVEVEEIKT